MRGQRLALVLLRLVPVVLLGGSVHARAEAESQVPKVSPQDLERRIAAAPSDAELRWRLLRAALPARSPEAKALRLASLLWVIENTPEAEIAGSPYARVHRLTEPSAYAQARTSWLAQVERQPQNLKVLLNAGRFFATDEPSLSAELFRNGAQLDPQNPEWATRLRALRKNGPAGDQAQGEAAVSPLEGSPSEATDQVERYHSLAKMAQVALDAGEDQKARAYAEELLLLSETLPQDWNYGNAVHDGNRILGHVALKAGDVEGAKSFLLRAGETIGSPQLNSFGPSLSLAKALLARGERDSVVRYLQLCTRFWEDRSDAVDKWIADIRAGRTPDLNRFLAFRSPS